MRDLIVNLALRHPALVITSTVVLTLVAMIPMLGIVDHIDTDPENMLRSDEEVRLVHASIKENFALHDFLVVGIVHDESVFTPAILERVYAITEGLHTMDGVIVEDILAPSEVDDIRPNAGGGIRVETLMESPPANLADAQQVLLQIHENPILRGKLASEDGKALAIFIPLESKAFAKDVGDRIRTIVDGFGENLGERYYYAGQPVAQDTFGTAMFAQMGIYAPIAFLCVFLLLLYFFREARIVAAPMIVAVVTVTWSMGLLLATGNTVHIMSSMIPIFLIPIAVLDSIHILSSIHDKLAGSSTDVDTTIRATLRELFAPMTLTSVTTFVGFAALLLTPIPPVRVFGMFIAFGVLSAWLLSILFIPAYVKLSPPELLKRFGRDTEGNAAPDTHLHALQRFSLNHRSPLLVGLALIMIVAAIGVTHIAVNDNPVYWFRSDNPLRVADKVMNEHLAGTYVVYLELASQDEGAFVDPALVRWASRLQDHAGLHPNVGGTSSVVDILEKVQFELKDRVDGSYALADSREALAQYLLLYEMSGGTPDELFKFITPTQDRINIWLQMRKGDNRDVAAAVHSVDEWVESNPPPADVDVRWAGLSYINVKWQQLMVKGMGRALAGSYLTVMVLVMLLFRSMRLGLVAMLPLTATILMTYGYVGWSGRDYDAPIAILSSLSLGLSIDFAIHFIQRTRDIYNHNGGNFEETMNTFFHEPAQTLLRNIVVISLGFVPMFFAGLVPYVTVGVLFLSIMVISGAVTFLFLPALLSLLPEAVISGRRPLSIRTAPAALLLLFGLLALPGISRAQASPDPDELMKEAHLCTYYAGDDVSMRAHIEVTDKNGRTRRRDMLLLRRDFEEGGEQRYFVYFFAPNDVRRTTFMAWKNPSGNDSRWIYVPSLDLIKPISANDKKSSFVGSDFSYEDVNGRHWSDDAHVYVGQLDQGAWQCEVVDSRPLRKDFFRRKRTWIDQQSGLIVREEYYDARDRLVKEYDVLEIREIDGHATATKRRMRSPRRGNESLVTVSDVLYDSGIRDDLFAERFMKSPPREYLE